MSLSFVTQGRFGRAAIALSTGALATASVIALSATPASAGPVQVRYTEPGSYSWTVPDGVTAVSLTVSGGQGGTGWSAWADKYGVGGKGARVGATFTVHGGQVLTLVVAGQGTDKAGGYGGGGAPGPATYDGAGGGGASRVSIDGKLLVVAAGGGGAAYGVNGGDSGRPGGAAPAPGSGREGGAATATAGGAAGARGATAELFSGIAQLPGCSTTSWGHQGASGTSGNGGAGADNRFTATTSGGGGGGAGYYGGGGGGGGAFCRATTLSAPGGGGGGGSSFVDPSSRGFGIWDGVRTGNGGIVIDFQDNVAPAAAPVVSPAPNAFGWNNTDVTVSWNWSDRGTGIDTARCQQADSRQASPGSVVLSAFCLDLSGNVTRSDQPVRIDTLAPKATWSIGADGYVAWHWSDDRSGVDWTSYCVTRSVPPARGGTVSATCSDRAGNAATVSAVVA